MEGDNKEAKKSILPIIIGIVAIVAVVAVVWIIMSRGNNDNGSSESGSTDSSEEAEEATEVTASELAADKVSETVDYGDYTAMYTLSKAIQNGQKIGEVVTVDGLVSHKLSSYSVVQLNPKKDEEGIGQVGTVFIIQDGEEADYPKDEQRIKITAKVMEVSPLNFQLVTLKDFVKVVEE